MLSIFVATNISDAIVYERVGFFVQSVCISHQLSNHHLYADRTRTCNTQACIGLPSLSLKVEIIQQMFPQLTTRLLA